MKALAKEKDLLEREKWDLKRQTKEATEQACILRSHMDIKENRIKELEAELTMVRRTLTHMHTDTHTHTSTCTHPHTPICTDTHRFCSESELLHFLPC